MYRIVCSQRIPRPLLVVAALAFGCSDSLGPERIASDDEAPSTISFAETSLDARGPSTFDFQMLDRCDPASFNEAFGPGTCVGPGKVTVDEFVDELAKKQTHNQWRNQPRQVSLASRRPLSVSNVGGEVHTFTPVAEFGGGFIDFLNGLTGNPIPAPECLDFANIEFIAAGASADVPALEEGTHRFMCCIHPWMRTTATVHH